MGLDAGTGVLFCADRTEKQAGENHMEKQYEVYPAVLHLVVCDDAVVEMVSDICDGCAECGGCPADRPVHGAVLYRLCGVGMYRRMVRLIWQDHICMHQFGGCKCRILRCYVRVIPEGNFSCKHALYRNFIRCRYGNTSGSISCFLFSG